MQRFVGDVGDLAKLIMASRGNRALDNVDAKLGHEIADCLWSLIVIAQELGIDLEGEFLKTMDDLDTVLDEATR
jgi:NTP pyrophosphatase (non-canonical NTP hydrolase)